MKIKKFIVLLNAIILVAFSRPAIAAAQQQNDQAITAEPVSEAVLPLDKNVRTGKLANGFTYFIRRNTVPAGRVILYLANKVGSVLENEDQRGLAHFMEHMNFNGTAHYPKTELVNYLQKNGVRFGADINAYTNFDETVYQLPLPTENPEVVKNGIQIVRDWAKGATLDAAEIDKERGVILEEERLGKGAEERMQRKYWPVILNNSRYANRIPIGLDQVILHFKPRAIQQFYYDWYRPDLQALIVVGDINVDEIEKSVKQKFSDLKNPVPEKPRNIYTLALTGKNNFIAVTDREMTQTALQVIIKQPGFTITGTSGYRRSMLNDLFNRMISQRYSELSVRPGSSFLEGSAGLQGFVAGLQQYNVSVVVKPGELEKGFKAVWRETERIKQYGFTETELERAKQSLLSDMNSTMNERDKIPSINYVNEYLDYFLNGTAAPGAGAEYKMMNQFLPGISLSELNGLAKKYIKNTDRDILVIAPEKEKGKLPVERLVISWMMDVGTEHLQAWTDEIAAKPLMTVKPAAGTIASEKKDTTLNLTELILGNGMKVVLKPTGFKNGEIKFAAFAAGGTSLYADTEFQSAANAAKLMMAGGIGALNAIELEKYLSAKQVGVTPYISELSQGISGYASPRDLETAFQLVHLYFTNPRKDTEVFAGIIDRSKASLANRESDPNNVFSDTVSAILSNYNFRRTGPTSEKFSQVDLDKAYRIFRERFADASSFTFVMVGSFEVDVVKALLEQYLGALPSTYTKKTFHDPGIRMPDGVISKTVYKGSASKAVVDLFFSGPLDYSKETVTQLEALKEVLQIRLTERLREEESGVYSPKVYVNTAKIPQARYAMVVNFGCAPENTEKLIASTLDEIGQLRKKGPAQVNIDKFKSEYEHSTELQLQTNDFWIGYLANQYQNQADPHEISSYRETLNTVTVRQIKSLANQYLSGKNFIRMVLMPENAPAVKPK